MSNYNGQFQDSGANILLPTPHSYANIEGATASQAYVVGQMVVFNNRLCEVTSAISSGDTFTIGSNIAYKNVGDIGKQLVASDGKGFYFDVKDGKYGFYPSASKTASEFVPFGGSDGFVPFFSQVYYGSSYVYDTIYLDSDNQTIKQARANDVSETYPLGSYGSFTNKYGGYNYRSRTHLTVNVGGTLYSNISGTITSQHLSANEEINLTIPNNWLHTSIFWFIPD